MAYMSQEKKAKIAPVVKAICAKYGVKASLAVNHHSTLVLNIKSGPLDFIGNYNEVEAQRNISPPIRADQKYMSVNPYWFHEHFSGVCKEFLTEVLDAMNVNNHDNSDIQSDYFDVGWYVSINIGAWDKPYVFQTLK